MTSLAAAAPAAATTTTSAAAGATTESARTESAAARLAEGEIGGSRTGLVAERHVRNDVGALLQISFEQLSVLSVGDAEPEAHRFQLFVDVDPCAPRAFDAGQRTK